MFRLLTYNLLAPIFVRVKGQPYSDFAHATEADLHWLSRQQRILERLDEVACDAICLQEVEYERSEQGEDSPTWVPPAWLITWASDSGYRVVSMPLSPKAWRKQAERNWRTAHRAGCAGLVTLVRSGEITPLSSSRSLIVRFEAAGHLYTLVNVHLEGHPGRGDKRAEQLAQAMKKADRGATHVVVAGDWNSNIVDDAPVAAFVAGQRGALVPLGPTWCGYPRRPSSVDQVLYDQTLRVQRIRVGLDDRDLAQGMPNDDSPSDHAPVWVELMPASAPRSSTPALCEPVLDPTEKVRLDAAWQALWSDAPAQPKGRPSDEQLKILSAFKQKKSDFLASLPSDVHRAYLRKKS